MKKKLGQQLTLIFSDQIIKNYLNNNIINTPIDIYSLRC